MARMKYWQKGGFIGLAITIIYSFLVYIYINYVKLSYHFFSKEIVQTILLFPSGYPYIMIVDEWNLIPLSYPPNILGLFVIHLVLFFEGLLIGALISLVISKINRMRKKK